MHRTAFSELPRFVQFSSLATVFIGWVLFAELIIDRHGIDRFLPYYRVGNLCPYDLAVILALALPWSRLRRPA
jgi:hypothetical protein